MINVNSCRATDAVGFFLCNNNNVEYELFVYKTVVLVSGVRRRGVAGQPGARSDQPVTPIKPAEWELVLT